MAAGGHIYRRTGTNFGPLVEHLRQDSKKSDQWYWRYDNEIVAMFSIGQLAILKMVAVRPYLLTDQNFTGEHIYRLRGIHMQGSTKFL